MPSPVAALWRGGGVFVLVVLGLNGVASLKQVPVASSPGISMLEVSRRVQRRSRVRICCGRSLLQVFCLANTGVKYRGGSDQYVRVVLDKCLRRFYCQKLCGTVTLLQSGGMNG